MSKYEVIIELNPEKVETLPEYIAYCKYYLKPKSEEKIGNYLFKSERKWYLNRRNKNKLLMEFKFLEREINSCISSGKRKSECEEELAKKLKDYKSNDTLKDFPLNWLKNEIIGKEKEISFENDTNGQRIKKISGIYDNAKHLQTYINKLPKYSFAIWFKFILNSPYFSKDDDEFYIIQNPILKETNFKVPMIRGSSWKGSLAHAFRELVNKEKNIEEVQKKIESFLRIFGAGSEIIKELEEYLKSKSKSLKEFKENFVDFILFELGMEINEELIKKLEEAKNYKDVSDMLAEEIWNKYKNLQRNLPIEFQTHKGRAIFYPTYFDRLSLEIINPHDRRKRAGTNPIHYEVIPKGTEGIFQLIYIPFNGILKSYEDLKEEVEKDLENLIEVINILQEKGVGAKTKLGWGRFKIEERKICANGKLNIPEGWGACQN